MHVEQLEFSNGTWVTPLGASASTSRAQLVLAFGSRDALQRGYYLESLRNRYPDAHIVSCSDGGHVMGPRVADNDVTATALRFDSTRIRAETATLSAPDESEDVGFLLAERMLGAGLVHVLVFAEGLRVNGSALARGLTRGLPRGVTVSGGLAADGERFAHTVVGLDGLPHEGRVVAVGFYGSRLKVSTSSFAGWQAFGDDRRITRSSGNVLYELDHQSAFALYKELLGPLGYALPASGLMFPLSMRESPNAPSVLRTILGASEEDGSVTFAGDVPMGWSATLVRTDLDQLIEGARCAATRVATRTPRPDFALAVSCIGRRLLLQRRVDEELHSLNAVLGADTMLAGFYSYGELAPSRHGASCELHNQTMTITTFSEQRNT